MNQRKECVYCEKPITKKSKEHIIPNAIGGLYESGDICCSNCNNFISQHIDAAFTKTFNPIISRIHNLAKTHGRNSQPVCTGKTLYNNREYDVKIKNGKIISCAKLSKEIKDDISKLDLKILAYDFPIDNTSFKNGFCKIAYNFALDKGISIADLKHGVKIEKKDKIKSITFEFPLIPFYPLNPVDEYIELESKTQLYHNLILFNQGNYLWCYIDLFNTFQYYVLLSDNWNRIRIHESYLQLIQKLDRKIPELYIRRPKDVFKYARYLNIEPNLDLEIFKKRVEEAIMKESLKKNMADVLSSKLDFNYFNIDKIKRMNVDEMGEYLGSLLLYFDENDRLIKESFRQVTLIKGKNIQSSYPIQLLKVNKENISKYTNKKFDKLNNFLISLGDI